MTTITTTDDEFSPARVAARAAGKAAIEWSVAHNEAAWASDMRWYQAYDRVIADFAKDEARAASFDDAEVAAAY